MLVLCNAIFPYHSLDQKKFILDTLEEDIGHDVAKYVQLTIPAYFEISFLKLSFGLFVFDAERSAIIKMIYS